MSEEEKEQKKKDREFAMLKPEQIAQLREVGFTLETKSMSHHRKLSAERWSWDRYVEEFRAFVGVHGHPYVSAIDPDHRKLGIWVANQRMRYKMLKKGIRSNFKETALTAQQALLLSEAGMAWDARHMANASERRRVKEMAISAATATRRGDGDCDGDGDGVGVGDGDGGSAEDEQDAGGEVGHGWASSQNY